MKRLFCVLAAIFFLFTMSVPSFAQASTYVHYGQHTTHYTKKHHKKYHKRHKKHIKKHRKHHRHYKAVRTVY